MESRQQIFEPIFVQKELVLQYINRFIKFATISGFGYLIDVILFVILTTNFQLITGFANVISSGIAITFVWFVSTHSGVVFVVDKHGRLLVLYWAYQILSIIFYSSLINYLATIDTNLKSIPEVALNGPLLAKVITTPANLFTNYIFIRLLTRNYKVKNGRIK